MAGGSNPGWRAHIFIFLVAASIVIARRPDAVLNAQFWAEDGAIWYSDAYTYGLWSLLLPQNGYLQTTSRIVAVMAQPFPLWWAPFIFNGVAIIIQALPVNLLISSRFSSSIPDMRGRILLSLLYLALPNSWEVHANLTNAQWHLALLAFMVIVSEPSCRPLWRGFDAGVVVLSGLSGPFSILLAPLAAFRSWSRRGKWSLFLFVLLTATASIQLSCILLSPQARSPMALGATPELLAGILSGQIFMGALIGQKWYGWIHSVPGGHVVLDVGISAVGLALCMNALFKSPVGLRLFNIFAAMILASALVLPQASDTIPQWQALSLPGVGGRYWFFPMLAFVAVLVWMLRRTSSRSSKMIAIPLLLMMLIGIFLDWRQPQFVDLNFPAYASRFENSPRGSEIIIPINPPGWSMRLVKH